MWTPPISLSRAPMANNLSSISISGGLAGFATISLPSPASLSRRVSIIRMGGGPRTYPGGVSKWQWKRMQAKKAKQLLKARLYRERQLYEMRKRAELRDAVAELERPWEAVEKAPALFSVRADEQLKALADRFQQPGGFDLWTDRDGPQVFRTPDGIPSARFFPKGAVHSVKPYGVMEEGFESDVSQDPNGGEVKFENGMQRGRGRGRGRRSSRLRDTSSSINASSHNRVGAYSNSKASEFSRSLGQREDVINVNSDYVKGDLEGNFKSALSRSSGRRKQRHGNEGSDGLNLGPYHTHRKISDSSSSSLEQSNDRSDSRRKPGNMKGNFGENIRGVGPRNWWRRSEQQHLGGWNAKNPGFKRPEAGEEA